MKTKNKIAVILTLFFYAHFGAILNAQVAGAPALIDYQGQLLNSNGGPITGTGGPGTTGTAANFEIRFRIWDSQSGGNLIWAEKQIVTVTGTGLFSVRLGEGEVIATADGDPLPLTGSVAQNKLLSAFNGKERFLGLTVLNPPATPGEISPRLALLASPFAVVAEHAKFSDTIADGAVGVGKIAGNAVGSAQIADNAVGSSEIINNSITASDIATNAVAAAEIAANAVGASEIAANAVGTSEIVDNSVQGSDIRNGTIGSVDIADNSITASDIAANAVGASEIAANAVGNSEIANSAVTANKLNLSSILVSGPQGSFSVNGNSNQVLQIKNTITNARIASFWPVSGLGGSNDTKFTVTGNAGKSSGGSSWQTFSDSRLKQDIRVYERGLDAILQLQPVKFRYKDDNDLGLTSDGEEIGFIAQDVLDVIPEAVNGTLESAVDGVYLSMKVDPIHWASVNAIKELNTKSIENLEQIKTLQNENAELKSRMTQLESRLDTLLDASAK